MRRRRSASSDSSKPTSNARMVLPTWVAVICSSFVGDAAVNGVSSSGREEFDEHLVDALGLVVVDPMRRVGQALDAVEVRDVLGLGVGGVRPWGALLLRAD